MFSRFLPAILLVSIFAQASLAQVREPVSVKVNGGMLSGTLTRPVSGTKPPIALIIPASGSVDRDGNSEQMRNNGLKAISDSLALRGIASLRFDKRGVGASTALTDESKLLFSDYVRDAVDVCRWVKKQKRYGKIFIIGHGEGAVIGARAAVETRADGLVSIEGQGDVIDTLLMKQFTWQGLKPGPKDTVMALFSELRRAGSIAKVPADNFYMSVFRPSVQKYFYSWIKFDPAVEISRVKCPVLIIQGTVDLQMDSSQAMRLAAAAPAAKLVVIPGMNHIFRQAPAEPPANFETYDRPDLPVDSTLIREVAAFIQKQ